MLALQATPVHAESNSRSPKKSSTGTASGASHQVSQGQTLWVIARGHGCSVDALIRANGLKRGDIIRVGQRLRIPDCDGRARANDTAAISSTLRHVVASGETLSAIAKQYDTSIAALRKRNRIEGSMIRPGQELEVIPGKNGSGRPIIGQSRGVPHKGQLRDGVQLPPSGAYYRRRPARAWGTNYVVHHIKRATTLVASKYKVHKLALGDISARTGGFIDQHRSHQSGRDVDLGLYFTKTPAGYPESFVVGNRKNLHLAANWLLISTLAATRNQDGGVSKIFLDYDVQGFIYEYAKKAGVPTRTLDAMFQYPHGRNSTAGFIRHEKGHADHYHVRFKCPTGDSGCSQD
ncbi:MAG TPA: penicillin-insensitive murein endopeptidase [Kofleriaceae bacterium]|nr:penicillin-insensitive murein endopeptidase [Kofleriaceae bacterium]